MMMLVMPAGSEPECLSQAVDVTDSFNLNFRLKLESLTDTRWGPLSSTTGTSGSPDSESAIAVFSPSSAFNDLTRLKKDPGCRH